MIEILVPFTRLERLAQIESAIVEAEKNGYGEIRIQLHNHQIVSVKYEEDIRFGNCPPSDY